MSCNTRVAGGPANRQQACATVGPDPKAVDLDVYASRRLQIYVLVGPGYTRGLVTELDSDITGLLGLSYRTAERELML